VISRRTFFFERQTRLHNTSANRNTQFKTSSSGNLVRQSFRQDGRGIDTATPAKPTAHLPEGAAPSFDGIAACDELWFASQDQSDPMFAEGEVKWFQEKNTMRLEKVMPSIFSPAGG
jgi:hypothetical protein